MEASRTSRQNYAKHLGNDAQQRVAGDALLNRSVIGLGEPLELHEHVEEVSDEAAFLTFVDALRQ